MKNLLFIALIYCSNSLFSQGNCLLYKEGSASRKACELSYKALEFKQGSKDSQLAFDAVIKADSNYAWAYYEKSVPYFKRGFLLEGLQLLNKAVSLEPINYLCNRAVWYWQYKNYNLCIEDLEEYYAMPQAAVRFDPGGQKNMKIVLGIAYAKVKNYPKAIKTIENHLKTCKSEVEIGLADYHTLGMLYVHNKEYDKAIEIYEKQFKVNTDMVDSYYYLGLAYKGKSNIKAAKAQFNKALILFEDKYRYRNAIAGFPVYKYEVKKELDLLR